MRQIGTLNNESQARILGRCLYVRGITNEVENDAPGLWTVWVHEEDRLAEATEILQRYQANPTAPEGKEAAKKAAGLLAEEERGQKAYDKRFKESKDIFARQSSFGAGLVTLLIIAACGYVAVRTGLKPINDVAFALQIATPLHPELFFGKLYDIRHGEVWRLITPVLLHFGPVHLFGNMLWFFQFGSQLEARKGSLFLIVQVLAIALVSNLAQYWMNGPNFGGMSGVVYGLFGYLWIRGKYDPASGLQQDQMTVVLSLVWFFVCLTGMVGPIANTAHASGLVFGMAWGFLAAKWKK